ncbi:MAG TPA: TonB-dependent receptor [Candidatus Kapabacteria bacterium]|nr:TonB-dependent receptor [Candidatus Kapabacteria bacterium]
MKITRLTLFLYFLFASASVFAQKKTGNINGVVVDSSTVQPIIGAMVRVHGISKGAVSRDSGQFLISGIPPGKYELEVRATGYKTQTQSVTVKPDETETVFFGLISAPIEQQAVVVTASKHLQSIQEVPVSTDIIAHEDITQRNAVQLDQVLRYVPGVYVNDDQVNIRGSSGYSRGVGSRVMLLMDGIPALSGDAGDMKFDAVPMPAVDHVEVVKGAGSALYGNGALGGVINVITKQPTDSLQLYAKAYAGGYPEPSYTQWQWYSGIRTQSGLDLGFGKKFGDLSLLASGGWRDNMSYRQDDDYHRWNLYTKVSENFSPSVSGWIALNAANDNHGNWIYWQSLDHALLAYDSTTVYERIYSFKMQLTGEVKNVISPDFISYTRGGFYRTTVDDNIDPLGPDSASKLVSHANAFSFEQQFSNQLSGVSLFTYGAQTTGSVIKSNDYGDRSQWDAALYAQLEETFTPQFIMTLGSRGGIARTENDPLLGRVDPKLGLLYNVSPDISLRASAGSGFRAPTVAEKYVVTQTSTLLTKPNPDLQYERSWSYEVGMNKTATLGGETYTFDGALFWDDYWNMIEPTFVYSLPAQIQFQNITRARVQGIDASLSSSLFDGDLKWSLAYTYMSNRDLIRDAPLKYRPRHILYAHVEGNVQSLFGGVDFRYLSKVESVDDSIASFINPLTGYPIIPDFAARTDALVTDVRVGIDLNKAFSLPFIFTLNIYNLFQYYYVEIPANIAPLRNFVAQVEFILQ